LYFDFCLNKILNTEIAEIQNFGVAPEEHFLTSDLKPHTTLDKSVHLKSVKKHHTMQKFAYKNLMQHGSSALGSHGKVIEDVFEGYNFTITRTNTSKTNRTKKISAAVTPTNSTQPKAHSVNENSTKLDITKKEELVAVTKTNSSMLDSIFNLFATQKGSGDSTDENVSNNTFLQEKGYMYDILVEKALDYNALLTTRQVFFCPVPDPQIETALHRRLIEISEPSSPYFLSIFLLQTFFVSKMFVLFDDFVVVFEVLRTVV